MNSSFIKRTVCLVLLALAIGLFAAPSRAQETAKEPKVAGLVPLSKFASREKGKFSYFDIVRISLLVNNHTLTNAMAFSDDDLAHLHDSNFDKSAKTNILLAWFGHLTGISDTKAQINLAFGQADAITNIKPGDDLRAPRFDESILTSRPANIGWTPAPSPAIQDIQKLLKKYFRLRQSWDQLSLPDSNTNFNPALISYTRDINGKNNVWNIIGAVGLVGQFTNATATQILSIVPNAAFDRVSGTTTNADSLAFRASTVYTSYETNPWLQAQTIRLSPVYSTDFEFRSSQIGGELEWEPLEMTKLLIGNGIALPKPGAGNEYAVLFIRPFVHFEGGSVLNAGDNSSLVQGQSYFRAGPNLQLQLRAGRDLPSLKNLVLTADWQEYESLRSGTVATRLFTAQAGYQFSANLSLNLQYQDGRLDLTAQKIQNLSVALGLKF